ncbi:MAG: hypothetical protein PVG99_02670 [Desulfobacteraceae bacterium]|jgi:hypothetical protein
MATKDKVRKTYEKPQLTQVKLQMEEAVLQACKTSDGDLAGKSTKWCGHEGCKITFGS